jgi:hypothetical protein
MARIAVDAGLVDAIPDTLSGNAPPRKRTSTFTFT